MDPVPGDINVNAEPGATVTGGFAAVTDVVIGACVVVATGVVTGALVVVMVAKVDIEGGY